jgi:hypothetical protein
MLTRVHTLFSLSCTEPMHLQAHFKVDRNVHLT